MPAHASPGSQPSANVSVHASKEGARVGLSLWYGCPADPTACTKLLNSDITITAVAGLAAGVAADTSCTVTVSAVARLGTSNAITVAVVAGANASGGGSGTIPPLTPGVPGHISFPFTIVGAVGTTATLTITSSYPGAQNQVIVMSARAAA